MSSPTRAAAACCGLGTLSAASREAMSLRHLAVKLPTWPVASWASFAISRAALAASAVSCRSETLDKASLSPFSRCQLGRYDCSQMENSAKKPRHERPSVDLGVLGQFLSNSVLQPFPLRHRTFSRSALLCRSPGVPFLSSVYC